MFAAKSKMPRQRRRTCLTRRCFVINYFYSLRLLQFIIELARSEIEYRHFPVTFRTFPLFVNYILLCTVTFRARGIKRHLYMYIQSVSIILSQVSIILIAVWRHKNYIFGIKFIDAFKSIKIKFKKLHFYTRCFT